MQKALFSNKGIIQLLHYIYDMPVSMAGRSDSICYDPRPDLVSSVELLPALWYLGFVGLSFLSLWDSGADIWGGLRNWLKFGSPWGSSKESRAFEARNSYFLHWVCKNWPVCPYLPRFKNEGTLLENPFKLRQIGLNATQANRVFVQLLYLRPVHFWF